MSGARWEMEWPASPLDTIMATRLFRWPAKWLDAFAGRDSSVARWLSLKVRIMNMWLLMEWVCSGQSCQMAEVTGGAATPSCNCDKDPA